MAQDVISTLFGVTPRNTAFDKYAQDQMIDFNKAGASYSDLGRANIERANALVQNAGTNIGVGIGRLLGGQTPQMVEEQRVQGMLGGASLQDPEQLMAAAERFAQAGDIPRAQALANQAQVLKTNQAELLKKQSDAEKVRSEMEMKQVAYQNRMRALQSRFPNMPEAEAQALAADEVAFRKLFEEQQAKVSTFGQQLIDAGFTPGTPEYQAKMNQFINNELAPKKSIGDQIAAGLTPLVGALAKGQATKAGEAGGTEIGKASAKVGAGYRSLDAIADALDTVDSGIYGGGYGPLAEATAKYTFGVVGNQERLVNTEAFRAYIGNVVIPMMQQLGGSDSNEELKKMEAIAGGNTKLEPAAIKRILNSARKAIKNDLARLEKQQQAVTEGQPLPLGPVGSQDTPRATKKYNPATNKLETIKER